MDGVKSQILFDRLKGQSVGSWTIEKLKNYFCLSSGDARRVDVFLALHDEGEHLSG